MDCPESVESYIHRAGRTARYQTSGRSILFLMPSEMQMLSRLQSKKIPIHFIKVKVSPFSNYVYISSYVPVFFNLMALVVDKHFNMITGLYSLISILVM